MFNKVHLKFLHLVVVSTKNNQKNKEIITYCNIKRFCGKGILSKTDCVREKRKLVLNSSLLPSQTIPRNISVMAAK